VGNLLTFPGAASPLLNAVKEEAELVLLAVSAESVVVWLKTNCCAMAVGKPVTVMLASAAVSASFFISLAFRYFEPSSTADQMVRDSCEFT